MLLLSQVAPKLKSKRFQQLAVGLFGVGFLMLFVNVRMPVGDKPCVVVCAEGLDLFAACALVHSILRDNRGGDVAG